MCKRHNYIVTMASNTERKSFKVNGKTPMNSILYVAKILIKEKATIINKVNWIQIEKYKEEK